MYKTFLKIFCIIVFALGLSTTVMAGSMDSAPAQTVADDDLTGSLLAGGDFSGQAMRTRSESGDMGTTGTVSPSSFPFAGIENTHVLATSISLNYFLMKHLAIGLLYSYMDMSWDHDGLFVGSGPTGTAYRYQGYTIFDTLHFTATWLVCTHEVLNHPLTWFLSGGVGPGWAETHQFDVFTGSTTGSQVAAMNPHDSGAALTWLASTGLFMNISDNIIVQFGVRYTDWGKYTLANSRLIATSENTPVTANPRARFYGIAPFSAVLMRFKLFN